MLRGAQVMVLPKLPPRCCLARATPQSCTHRFHGLSWSRLARDIIQHVLPEGEGKFPAATSFLAPGKVRRPLQENVVILGITRSVFGDLLSSRLKLRARLVASYSALGLWPRIEGAGSDSHWPLGPVGEALCYYFRFFLGNLISTAHRHSAS